MKVQFEFLLRKKFIRRSVRLQILIIAGFLFGPMLASVMAGVPATFAEQIQNQPLFGSPLEWIGEEAPASAQSQELLGDIALFKADGIRAGLDGLEEFLQKYPQSGWAPALHDNLAEYYRKHGNYSLALEHWELAWNATKASKQAVAEGIAVRTIAGWTRLLASLGEKEKLNILFQQLDNLQLPFGAFGTTIQETREGLGVMNARPGTSYRCGSFALGHMASALHLDIQLCRKFYEMESPDGGFHMDQLLALAETNGMHVEAVRRPAGADLVVPSVIHWKLNHYAAITEKKGDSYRVEDPTFGGHIWMDTAAINAEASGEFIVLKNKVPAGWQKLSLSECANIYGKGFPNIVDDSDDDGSPSCPPDSNNSDGEDSEDDPPSGNDGQNGGDTSSSCPGCGMPQWSVSEPYMTLWLKDVPLLYRQSDGRWMKLALSYKSTGENLGNKSFFGTDWSCGWVGMAQTSAWEEVSNHLASGGVAGFATNGTLDYKTARSLSLTSATSGGNGGAVMVIKSPTSSQNGYGFSSSGWNILGITNFYLTQRTDRYGRTLQKMDYQFGTGSAGSVKVADVVDMDGRINVFSYNSTPAASADLISAVTDPYSRTAHFNYNSSGLLTNIVDAQGMPTYFQYDGNDRITNMITPYGTTAFQYFSGTDANGGLERALLITEPTGDHQLYAYRDDASDTIPYPGDSYYDLRMSFHWNRKQYQAISSGGKANVFAMTTADYQVASIKHWLHKSIGGIEGVSDTLDSTADPYDSVIGARPNCITYQYYDESAPLIGTLRRTTSVLINGQLAETINRNALGRTTNCIYYSSYGTVASYTNFFDPSGEILQSEHGPRGERTDAYGYDSVITNLLVVVTNALGDVTTYTHAPTTLKLTSTVFPGGLIRTNIYYSSGVNEGFLQMQADIGVRTNYFTYVNGNIYIQTNELGLVTTNFCDNLNRLVSTAYPDGTTISNVYNKLDIAATKDRLNQWAYFGHNQVRQLLAVTNVNSEITTYDYCGCGAPDQITRWNGSTPLTTILDYDIIGRLANVTYPDGYQLNYVYDANDRPANITDVAGYQLQLSYALFGLENRTTGSSLGGQTLSFEQYDEYGRLTNSIDRNLVQTAMGYDFLDRILTRQNFGADGKFTGPESFVYNALGLTNYTDQLSHLTSFVRDAATRVRYETNANKEVLQFAYNPADELLALTDGKNQTTRWNYDAYGRVTNKVDATALTVLTYLYDPNNRLTNRWSVGKGTTIYRYDPIGNLINVDYSLGSVYMPSIYFTYDGLNRLTNMVDGIGATAFGWTDGGQLANETGPWSRDAVTYAYFDRLRTNLSLIQPSNPIWIQKYTYDSVMRLSSVLSPAAETFISQFGAFTYSYSGAGNRPTELQMPASYIINLYDSLARLTNTYVNSSYSGITDQHIYSFDSDSEVTQQTFPTGRFLSYTYDNIGQLKTASGKGPGGVINRLQEQFGYTYDAAWNLNFRTNNTLIQTFNVNTLNELTNTTVNGAVPYIAGSTTSLATNVTVNGMPASVYSDATFAATNVPFTNGNNTLTAVAHDSYGRVSSSTINVNYVGTGSFIYDLNGNLTSDGNRNFAYDDENQLISVWVTNGWRSDFVYDGLARRRISKDYSWNGGGWSETNEVHYIYDGNLVFQERDSNNVPLMTYTRGNDLSGSLQGAGGIGGLLARSQKMLIVPAIVNINNPNYQWVNNIYYHSDGNGNITLLIGENGTIQGNYEYDPFGNILSLSGLYAQDNKYRFSSKEWNENSGIYYYGFRFYDSNLQRWLNRDPIQEEGGLNLYGYVQNNPVNLIDLLGLRGDAFDDMGLSDARLNQAANNSGLLADLTDPDNVAENHQIVCNGMKALKNGAKAVAKEAAEQVAFAVATDGLGDLLKGLKSLAQGANFLKDTAEGTKGFIVDSNLSPTVAQGLRDAGHDAIHVQELFGSDPGDAAITAAAKDLNVDVLTANIKDFPTVGIAVPGNLSAAGQLQYILWQLKQ